MVLTAAVAWLVPREARGPTLAGRVVARNALVARRMWLIVVSGFVEPVLYLLALDVGLGDLVGEVTGPGGAPLPYTAFIAPGLLAASVMNGAVFESTFAVFFRLRHARLYEVMLTTPLRPVDIVLGEIGFSQLRGVAYAAAFLAVMAAMGLVASPWVVLVLPATVLLGLAFSALGILAVSFMHSWLDLDLVNLALLPLFLFSATFYPLDVYPPAVQWLTQLSPLYHGAVLVRGLTLGAVDATLLAHAAVLLGVTAVAGVLAVRRIHRQLRV